MKTKTFIKLFLTLVVCGTALAFASCADAEDGEGKADWELRNTISGPAWRVHSVKQNDTWINEVDLPFWFEVKFSAHHHDFKSTKFYYKDGESDESTREEFSSANKTSYVIKSAKEIEATVDGKPYFRITLKEKVSSTMHCDIFFYNENKTYEVKMWR